MNERPDTPTPQEDADEACDSLLHISVPFYSYTEVDLMRALERVVLHFNAFPFATGSRDQGHVSGEGVKRSVDWLHAKYGTRSVPPNARIQRRAQRVRWNELLGATAIRLMEDTPTVDFERPTRTIAL